MPHPESLIAQWLLKHRIDPCDAPLPGCPEPDRDSPDGRAYRLPLYASATREVRPLDDVVAVTTMRNEEPFILAWVAYHLGVGITHFLV